MNLSRTLAVYAYYDIADLWHFEVPYNFTAIATLSFKIRVATVRGIHSYLTLKLHEIQHFIY